MNKTRTWAVRAVVALVVIGGGYLGWQYLKPQPLPPGIAGANGRIEATEIDIAAKIGGRVKDILVYEGDFVTAGQVLVKMDTETLAAQRREADAQRRRAIVGVTTAKAQVVQRRAEKAAAIAVVAQRRAELDAAEKRFKRSQELAQRGTAAVETLDNDRARYEGAKAAVSAAEAQVAAAELGHQRGRGAGD